MLTTTLIIDDFFQDPVEIRNSFLKMDYPDSKGTANYPGRDSSQRLDLPGIDEFVSELTGEKVISKMSPSHGHARISMASDDIDRKYTVHIDPGAVWSGIIYLNLPEQCQGGTEFFRHIETGMERAPIYPHELEAMGAKNYMDGCAKIIENDSNDMSKWEPTMTVPMRFNRLVLLRPWYFHTSGISFGNTNENSRLVYLLFFGGVE